MDNGQPVGRVSEDPILRELVLYAELGMRGRGELPVAPKPVGSQGYGKLLDRGLYMPLIDDRPARAAAPSAALGEAVGDSGRPPRGT